jgi:hypothetical protein
LQPEKEGLTAVSRREGRRVPYFAEGAMAGCWPSAHNNTYCISTECPLSGRTWQATSLTYILRVDALVKGFGCRQIMQAAARLRCYEFALTNRTQGSAGDGRLERDAVSQIRG